MRFNYLPPLVTLITFQIVFLGTPMSRAADPTDATPAAQPVTAIEGITEYRLPNGLQVLLFPDDSKSIVTVNMTVFVGSRHEGYGEAGMAHLLEHMLFKGTPSNPAIPVELKTRGANYNGTTWHDRTNYYETLPAATAEQASDNLEYAIRLEADRLVNSNVLGDDLLSEMTVVRNEFESGENSPQRILMQRVQAAAYEWHNYGRVTIGNQSDIERVPVLRLREFYRKFYRPDNTMLVVAGRFDPTAALEHVEKYFGILERPQLPLDQTYTTEPAQDGERTVVLRRVGNTQLIQAAYHVPSAANREFAAVEMLSSIMSAQPSGRLYSQLVKSEVASSTFGFAFPLHDPGLIFFGAQVPVDKSIEAARLALIETLEGVAENPIQASELQRAKNTFLKDRELRAADATQLAIELSEWAAQGDWRLYFLFRDYVDSLTTEECNAAAEQFLTRNNRTIGLFIPSETSQRTEIPSKPNLSELLADYQGRDDIQQGEEFLSDPLAIEARTTRGQLSNGMQTAFLPKKTRGGTVNIRIGLRYGNEQSLKPFLTAADYLPELLMRGTKNMDFEQIQDRLDELLADVSTSGQTGLLTMTIETKRENVKPVMELVREILRLPSFNAEQLELIRRQQIAGIESQMTEPGTLGRIALQKAMTPYPVDDVRYVMSLEEMLEHTRKLTIDDVRELYATQLDGRHGEITAIGDFDPDELQAACEAIVQDWESEVEFARIATPARTDVKAQSISIETPDKSNALYFAGQTIAMRDDDPDYPALLVGNHILGAGAISSRLGERIRQNEGLSYGVGSRLSAHPVDKRGSFSVSAIYNPGKRQRLVDAVNEEIQRLLDDGITLEELEMAKQGILSNEQVNRTSDASLCGLLASSIFAKRDLQFNVDFETQIQNLTKEQVDATLRKYINPQAMFVVTAGDFAAQTPDEE